VTERNGKRGREKARLAAHRRLPLGCREGETAAVGRVGGGGGGCGAGQGKRYPAAAAFAASSCFFCASIARRSGADAISC
jgi:hypothetical protein